MAFAKLAFPKRRRMRFHTMTLGDVITDPITGTALSAGERHRDVVEVAVASEAAGFDGVNLGEHHGLDYVLSCPPRWCWPRSALRRPGYA
jgi:alkanesulfonate monooxygenase SsuD/methylene tetrahydromethanopterin reductase-like flavin-dependent oxidoreductase (luciferase family)